MNNTEQVKAFLRGQNMEQLSRIEEAIDLYEQVVAEGFDSIGPYDRLIALYSHRAEHAEVIRIADLALAQVHTYEDKRSWYRTVRAQAEKARSNVPTAARRHKKG